MSKRKPHSAILLNWIGVDHARDLPLYRQIGDQLRGAILRGDLAHGTYLPASRVLASDLGVSRITTLQAYDQLTAEGFLGTQRGSGTRVARSLAEKPGATGTATQSLFQTVSAHAEVHVQGLYDGEPPGVAFQPGIPAFTPFQGSAGRGSCNATPCATTSSSSTTPISAGTRPFGTSWRST